MTPTTFPRAAGRRTAIPGPAFEAVLRPHRSLSRGGFLALMTVIATISFTAGGVFWSMGAWPIFGFFGLDVALIYMAFRLNFRQGRRYERLTLGGDGLILRRVSVNGRVQGVRLPPNWLRVELDDPPGPEGGLTLATHGQRVTLGAFLTAEELLALSRALRHALDDWRHTAPPSPAEPMGGDGALPPLPPAL